MKLSIIFGTRPEAIKLCPVVIKARQEKGVEVDVCVTGQHRQLLDQVLRIFNVRPDTDLGLMKKNQTLGSLTSKAIKALDGHLDKTKPDMVLVQGDTTTALCAAMAAFYHRIPIGHVEAGLRTWNKYSPFPEEVNRSMITRIADLHFAPTAWAKGNLRKEGVPESNIFVTGNTGVDALKIVLKKIGNGHPDIPGLPQSLLRGKKNQLVLITGHRRENFGEGFKNICNAIAELSRKFPAAIFVYPVHLNPNVQGPVYDILGGIQNVFLIAPLDYVPFVALMKLSRIILTDSGGVQEEAPSLGKPVLVMRGTTERPEAVEAGTAWLVGADKQEIVNSASRLLTDARQYNAMARVGNPFGDGKACGRILRICREFLSAKGRQN